MKYGPRSPIPPVACSACNKPLTERWVVDHAKAYNTNKRSAEETWCPQCRELGTFDMKILVGAAKIAEALKKVTYSRPLGESKRKRHRKCPICEEEGGKDWFMKHGAGVRCSTSGLPIPPEMLAAMEAEMEEKRLTPKKPQVPAPRGWPTRR